MFILRVTMLEGRSTAQKRALSQRLTKAASEELRVPHERVRLIIQEVPPINWSVGGVPIGDDKAGPS